MQARNDPIHDMTQALNASSIRRTRVHNVCQPPWFEESREKFGLALDANSVTEKDNKPHYLDCGGFRWITGFRLTDPTGAPITGYLIQRIIRRKKVFNCDHSLKENTKLDYFELFKLNENGATVWFDGRTEGYANTNAGDPNNPSQVPEERFFSGPDEWYVPAEPETYGTWSIEGILYFSRSLPKWISESGRSGGNRAQPESEALPSIQSRLVTDDDKKSLGPVLLIRKAFSSWHCCFDDWRDWTDGEATSLDPTEGIMRRWESADGETAPFQDPSSRTTGEEYVPIEEATRLVESSAKWREGPDASRIIGPRPAPFSVRDPAPMPPGFIGPQREPWPQPPPRSLPPGIAGPDLPPGYNLTQQ